jgi:glucosamine 6-phosphate synthetase-like amidotransferase/phosphosugar isomerase protein
VTLDYRSAGRTAGTIGFAASVLACAWLATEGRMGCPANIGTIYRKASKSATRLAGKIGNKKSMIIIGDSLFHPAAMYGALKFNEVLGTRAVAYPLEDFFHAPLFGVKKGDRVLVIGSDSRSAYALRKADVESFHIPSCKGMMMTIGSFLHAVFFMQHLVLQIAKKQKRKECHFLLSKKLDASSGFIY